MRHFYTLRCPAPFWLIQCKPYRNRFITAKVIDKSLGARFLWPTVYIIIPACAQDTRLAEIDNVKEWALSNNLTLNTSKTKEIVFQNPKVRQKATTPAPLPGIVRESSLKVLGVTLT